MNLYAMTDSAILLELGARVKALRLRKNRSQKELSEATLLSTNAIKSLETGKAKLATLIAVLRELGALDEINQFIPEISISPIELAKRQGKKRLRARISHENANKKDNENGH